MDRKAWQVAQSIGSKRVKRECSNLAHIGWPKYWSFSLSISPSIEYSRLISFRIDCFDFLAVHDTSHKTCMNFNLVRLPLKWI